LSQERFHLDFPGACRGSGFLFPNHNGACGGELGIELGNPTLEKDDFLQRSPQELLWPAICDDAIRHHTSA
jgi:hypothetical protein